MKRMLPATVRATRIVAGGLLVALFGSGYIGGTSDVGAAQRPAENGTTYDFQRHYQTGEIDRYKGEIVLTTNSPQTGGNDRVIHYTFVVRETVKSSAPDGSLTLVIEYEQAAASIDGENIDYTAKMPRITEVRDNQGRFRITTEGGKDPNARMMVQLIAKADEAAVAGMPGKPMKVGETWKLDAPNPNMKWSGLAGLESVESLNGARALKVNYRTDLSSADASVATTHTGATMLVDVLTGKTIKLALRTDAQVDRGKTTVDIQYNHVDDSGAPISIARRAYRVGDTDRYQLNVVATISDPQAGGNDHIIKYALLVRETVNNVAPDGTATLMVKIEKAGVSTGDMEADVTAMMPTVTEVRSAQGGFQIKSKGGDDRLGGVVLQMLAQVRRAQNDIVLSKPVRVLNSWKFTRTEENGLKTTVTAELASVEATNGAKTLKLKYTADMLGKGPADARRHDEAAVLLDAQTGKTIKIDSHSTSSLEGNKITMDIVYVVAANKGAAGDGSRK